MKRLYFLDEEEKKRILNLHESATKRQYLGEQQTGAKFIYNNPNDKAYDYKMENGKYYFKGKEGTTNKKAQKYKNWYEAKAEEGIKAIKALFDAGTNVTTTEIKPATNTQVTNPDPNKATTVTANAAQTTPTTPAGTTQAAGTTPAGTNAGSGVVSLNVNDIAATSETGAPAVAGTDTAEKNMSSSTPVVKASNAPDEDNSVNPNIANK